MNESSLNKNLEDDWMPTANRYVAFIDIMGFKNMVEKLKHEEIYSMMKKVNLKRNLAENIDWDQKNLKLIRTTTYSDSIMVYSKDESKESLDHLIKSVASLTYGLFIEGIPHKGAVAYGLMTLDTKNAIFFGQPLIDAYLIQEELGFYGIVIHGTCESQIEMLYEGKMVYVKNYLCPFKTGFANHLTVYPSFTNSETYVTESDNMFNSIKKFRFTTSGILRKYIDNTETYLKSI